MRAIVPMIVVAVLLTATGANQAQQNGRPRLAAASELARLRDQIASLEKRLAALEANAPAPPYIAPRAQDAKPPRVGKIYIVGNEKTASEDILRLVPLSPGDVLTLPEWQIGAKKMATNGVIVVDPKTGIQATIEVFGDVGQFKDVVVTVKEKK
jgi:hypothetical protein